MSKMQNFHRMKYNKDWSRFFFEILFLSLKRYDVHKVLDYSFASEMISLRTIKKKLVRFNEFFI